jgi:hypothetical protein
MDTIRKTENINQKRRQLLSRAAIGTMGIAVAGTASLLPSQLVAAFAGAPAQLPGIKRTDLIQYDLSVPGREVIQALVEIPPGQPPGTRIRAKNSSTSSKACWNIGSTAGRRSRSRPVRSCSSRTAQSTP